MKMQSNCPSRSQLAESSSRRRPMPMDIAVTRRSQRRRSIEEVFAAIGPDHIPIVATELPPANDCTKCGATRFAFEPRTFCCCDGEVHISNNEMPAELINLLGGTDDNALHFQNYVRIYNNMFAFSSLGGHIKTDYDQGIYVFSLLGKLYHYVPNLLPNEDNPRYLQLYFYDGHHEKERRLGSLPNLRPEIISILMDVMEQNPYAAFFRSLREFDIVDNTRIIISHNPSSDQRVFNAPTSEEVAAVLLDESSLDTQNSPHIVVQGKSNDSHRVLHYYGCYDPLQYPLLYPRGECGWHQGIKRMSNTRSSSYTNPTFPISSCLVQTAEDLLAAESEVARKKPPKDNREVSCREYYAYKFQRRPGNYLLKCRALSQQYITDTYVKIENTRLDYLRKNQSTIRGELYQGIIDSLGTGHSTASNIGRHIILPPSFIGGPRDVKRRYLNAMTLVQRYGRPDLFITVTCNPNWPEIKDQKLAREKSEDCPDLETRIFHAKLVMLKNEIIKNKVFGDVAARVDVIEFQKRGLPHAHLLIILEKKHKIISPEDFDKYVCAEIPSNENPHLRAAVLRHMIHGPCGNTNPNCPCMKQKGGRKTCRFKYPKAFAEFTTCGDDSYPVYRRRKSGETVNVRGARLDNRWVTPYNPYLLAMFDCHINVEICSTIQAVKYLYKYIYKGHDSISFKITQDSMRANDEIASYQSARWISPPEAAWRIFKFNLYDIDPAVIPLQVHLPNMQHISFNEHESVADIASDGRRSSSMLTEFFRNNYKDQNARKYLYHEYPEFYVWHPSEKMWSRRQKRKVVGRVAYVGPSEGDRYYLRVLLSHVRGPTSFGYLLDVNGHKCTTFQEAAQKRGLLQQDGYAESCMDEATQVQMPGALRRLFSTLLVFCEPDNPATLWEKYYAALSEDYKHQHPLHPAKVLQLTCREVERFLEGMGKSLKTYRLHHLLDYEDDTIRITRDTSDALASPIPDVYKNAYKQLNTDQHEAYMCIMQHVENNKQGAFFIDGPGGTGKTFLYCALYAQVRTLGKIVLPTASSGIAA